MTHSAITALHLGNFKAFANPQRIPLRLITLVYGPRSGDRQQRQQQAQEIRQMNEARFDPQGLRDRLLARRVEQQG